MPPQRRDLGVEDVVPGDDADLQGSIEDAAIIDDEARAGIEELLRRDERATAEERDRGKPDEEAGAVPGEQDEHATEDEAEKAREEEEHCPARSWR